MKRVLFITNIPAPYRIDFYNELGKYVDLTVLFEGKGASNQGIKFNWNIDEISNFEAVFLSEGDIRERRIDWKILSFLKNSQFDEIVVTNYSYFTEMIALLYLKLRRIPYYMETDGGLIRDEHWLKKKYKTFLVSGAKGYFSPSKYSDDYLVYYGAKQSKIYRYPFTSLKEDEILSCPLSVSERNKIRTELDIGEYPLILGVGQFIHRKGWDVLIKAMHKMDRYCTVVIVGGVENEEYFKLKQGSKCNFRFVEFKSKDELAMYYKAADVFVLPTREDVWGLVINEALAYGLPVITTDKCVAGLELINNGINGYIVKSEDTTAIAECCNKILAKNDDSMRVAALNTIRPYSISNMAYKHHIVLMEENDE